MCYGSRFLLHLNRKPNLKKYIHWIDSVHLIDTSCFIHGSFNFDSRSDVIKSKQYVALSHWEFIITHCSTLSIFPHILFTLTDTKSS